MSGRVVKVAQEERMGVSPPVPNGRLSRTEPAGSRPPLHVVALSARTMLIVGSEKRQASGNRQNFFRNLLSVSALNTLDEEFSPTTVKEITNMNKRIFWISAVVITASALSLHAFAQPVGNQRGPGGPRQGQMNGQMPGGFGMDRMGGGNFIFRNEEAAKMLELTAEQRESIQKILEEARAQRPQPQQGGGTPPNPEEMRQRIDELQTKINQVLKPEQQTKLNEMSFQLTNGLDSPMLSGRTLEVLELTAEQKAKIRQISGERNAAFRTAMQGFDFRGASQEEREKFRADNEARGKTYSDQIKAVLTAEQREKAERLIAGATELREKLGIPQPGQGRGPERGQDQGRGQRPRQDGSDYRPGDGSWRPGQDVPNSGGNPSGTSRFRRDNPLRVNADQ